MFCGAGGATRGYQEVGFYVTGVDIDPQPNYVGDEFIQADAFDVDWSGFDVIHASPPCQRYSKATAGRGIQENHPDFLPIVLSRLSDMDTPWIVENVMGAPMKVHLKLCGSMFGLKVRRHRVFQTSPVLYGLQPECRHEGLMQFAHKQERAYANAMGCWWMTVLEAREAIPPAYTRYIGGMMLEELDVSTD